MILLIATVIFKGKSTLIAQITKDFSPKLKGVNQTGGLWITLQRLHSHQKVFSVDFNCLSIDSPYYKIKSIYRF